MFIREKGRFNHLPKSNACFKELIFKSLHLGVDKLCLVSVELYWFDSAGYLKENIGLMWKTNCDMYFCGVCLQLWQRNCLQRIILKYEHKLFSHYKRKLIHNEIIDMNLEIFSPTLSCKIFINWNNPICHYWIFTVLLCIIRYATAR